MPPPTILARKHGVRRVAVLEQGWIGGGNTGRNTQVLRSNYFYPASTAACSPGSFPVVLGAVQDSNRQ